MRAANDNEHIQSPYVAIAMRMLLAFMAVGAAAAWCDASAQATVVAQCKAHGLTWAHDGEVAAGLEHREDRVVRCLDGRGEEHVFLRDRIKP